VATVIVAKDVTHRYAERVALDGFTLDVPAGVVFGLLGPNGSGKSTFITLLAAMEQPQSGELRVFGEKPAVPLRARVGTVFQENAQDPLMTPRETLELAARLFGRGREAPGRLLDRVGLAERASDPIATLSGGMRRRLEIARALLHDPDLLLLDEPTTGVDPGERHAFWDSLQGLDAGRETPRSVLLASNDLAEADTVCDVVAFIEAGRVVAVGTPAELKRGLRRESITLSWPGVAEAQLAAISSWPGVGGVTHEGDTVQLAADDAQSLIPRVFEEAAGAIRAVSIEPSTLEHAYFQHVRRRPAVALEEALR
jgi:ABC-2 type transport system ATP-binding protein